MHERIYEKNPEMKNEAVVLLMPLAETIKELASFILKGLDLLDHKSIFLLRTINHRVTLMICILLMSRPNLNLFRVFPTRVSLTMRYPDKFVIYSSGSRTISVSLTFNVVLECELL